MNERSAVGCQGEAVVAAWLEEQGFTLISKNYRIRTGEVDLIVQRDEVLAFVEVKTRRAHYFAISSSVTRTKQRRVVRAAKHYVMVNGITDSVIRFDVATVLLTAQGPSVEYIPNAFMAA